MTSKTICRKYIVIVLSIAISLLFVSCNNKSHEEELANLRKQIKEYRIENERLLIQNRMLKHKIGMSVNPPDSSMETGNEKPAPTPITPITPNNPTPIKSTPVKTSTNEKVPHKLKELEEKESHKSEKHEKTAYVRKPVHNERQEIITDDNYQFTKKEFNKTFLNRTENEVLRVLGAPKSREKIDKRIVLHYPADCLITQGSIKYQSIQIVLLDSLVEYINFY